MISALIFVKKQQDGTTYYFDYTDLDGATNQYSTTSYEALITLDDPASEWSCECWHQTRIASVSFYK